MPLTLQLNGEHRSFPALSHPATLELLVAELRLQGDRVAIEHNGVIVSRRLWSETPLRDGDRLEVVHFVGGGSCSLETSFVRSDTRLS